MGGCVWLALCNKGGFSYAYIQHMQVFQPNAPTYHSIDSTTETGQTARVQSKKTHSVFTGFFFNLLVGVSAICCSH